MFATFDKLRKRFTGAAQAHKLTIENSGLTRNQIDVGQKALKILGVENPNRLTKHDVIIFLYAVGLNPTDDVIDSKFRHLKLHMNEHLTFVELCHIWHSMLQDLTDEEEILKRAFQFFDKDGNGEISVTELRNTMHELGDLLTEQEIEAFMDIMDVNNDGVIGYQEFLDTLRTQAPDSMGMGDEEDKEGEEGDDSYDADNNGATHQQEGGQARSSGRGPAAEAIEYTTYVNSNRKHQHRQHGHKGLAPVMLLPPCIEAPQPATLETGSPHERQQQQQQQQHFNDALQQPWSDVTQLKGEVQHSSPSQQSTPLPGVLGREGSHSSGRYTHDSNHTHQTHGSGAQCVPLALALQGSTDESALQGSGTTPDGFTSSRVQSMFSTGSMSSSTSGSVPSSGPLPTPSGQLNQHSSQQLAGGGGPGGGVLQVHSPRGSAHLDGQTRLVGHASQATGSHSSRPPSSNHRTGGQPSNRVAPASLRTPSQLNEG